MKPTSVGFIRKLKQEIILEIHIECPQSPKISFDQNHVYIKQSSRCTTIGRNGMNSNTTGTESGGKN